MKRMFAVVCLAALMISLFSAARTEAVGPAARMRSYGAGKYEVGKNFEAGEYILFSAPNQMGFFAVLADREGADVIAQGTFDTHTILTVEDGDCLILADCVAVFADDYYSVGTLSLTRPGGMFKVGVDVKPGKYTLLAQAHKTAAYRIYSDSRFRLAEEEKTFQSASKVNLKNGQYLELINCSFYPKDIATPTPTPTPSPTPKPTPEPTTEPTLEPTSAPAPEIKSTPRQTEQPERENQPLPTPTPIIDTTSAPTQTQEIETTPEPTPTPRKIQKVRIDSNRSPIIRSLPSTMGEKIGVAEAGAEYELLDTDGKWYQIRLEDGTAGWITVGMAEIIE